MSRPDKLEWKRAVDDELESPNENRVFKLIKRPKSESTGKKPNILDSRWIFKVKTYNTKKARIVIRGFKDKNFYDLRETYAPESKLPIIRTMFAIANKHDLPMHQMDVKTAFLNSLLHDEIFMEIPDGMPYTEEERKKYVLKLEESLYGSKTNPKR